MRRRTLAAFAVMAMLAAFMGVATYGVLSALWSGQVTGHVANAAISGVFTGGVAAYSLGTVKPGDSGAFQLVITNTGDVALNVAQPTTTGLPAYLAVSFTKPPPQPGFPARIDPGQSVTIDIGWVFDLAYGGPGNLDFSFTVNVVANQA